MLLARKKKTQSGHRASATRLVNQATTAMDEENVDADRLSTIQRLLATKVKTLESLDKELADLVPENELEDEIQNSDEYMENVYGILDKLSKILERAAMTNFVATTAAVQPATTAPPRAAAPAVAVSNVPTATSTIPLASSVTTPATTVHLLL